MPDYSFDLFDTAIFGAAAAQHTLFQVSEGGDAVHVPAFTNMRGAGQLPQSEKLVCDWIGVVIDHAILIANIRNLYIASNLEVIVANRSVLRAPLARFAASSAMGGHFTQAVAADLAQIGLEGNGYSLRIPITIDGGTHFTVLVNQGTAVAAASNMKVILSGVLSMA